MTAIAAAAHWVRSDLLLVPADFGHGDTWLLCVAPKTGLDVVTDGYLDDGAGTVYLPLVPAGNCPAEVATQFPALAKYKALRLEGIARAEVEQALTGQVWLARWDGGTLTVATGVQLPGVLDDLYAKSATRRELGAIVRPGRGTTFTLWAPTAQVVTLLLWPPTMSLRVAPLRFPAQRQADGTWLAQTGGPLGARYQYEVVVYAPSTGRIETNIVTDPYSVALTRGSTHSVVVDLADPRWAPDIWRNTPAPLVPRPVDQAIYELHVRDFSRDDETVPERLRGTFLAFAESSSDGMTHLRALAEAGMTTIHLLPTFNIASLPDRAEQVTPPDLTGFAPDSDRQQALIAEIADRDAWNWGYDPRHWSVPEGSYCVDPEGGARTREFRTMVGALHAVGLQVVLDVVYNHTAASGQNEAAMWDRIVPGYYHRLCPQTGEVEDSTCCHNTATEHAMAGKAMIDSLVLWAKHYRVDGFRFDLMGHHTKANLRAARAALDALTLERDGIDGRRIFLYGEGWNFGEVQDGALFEQAAQGNLGGTGIATFSDRLRDAVIGGTPTDDGAVFAQGFATGLSTTPNHRPIPYPPPAPHIMLRERSESQDPELTLATLAHATDLLQLGLAGNLRSYSLRCTDGIVRRGDEIDYNGQPAGYADDPAEIITYVDAHDNETLFDYGILKLPVSTSMADRIRMNTLALACVAFAQTPLFWHAGTDLLRSKSLDRNSYDAGDWFNLIDWRGIDNGFGRGLPSAPDNQYRWPAIAPLLANPALKPGPVDMAAAREQALDLLRIRSATPLLRLGSASLIRDLVTFPLSGPTATPGVITMLIDNGDEAVLVILNATPQPATQQIPALSGRNFTLHPVQQQGADAVVRETTWDAQTATAATPARTAAVLTSSDG